MEQDTRPDFIKDYEVGTGEVEYNGKKTIYAILKRELKPELPGFLGYPKGEHLFISEEVPEKFRYPQLVHEIIEFTELHGQPGRCVQALKRELEVVPDEIRKEYLEYRKDFFIRLVEFYKESTNEEFKAEITASRDFLMNMKQD